MPIIYKVCDRSLWEAAEASGSFVGAEIDLKDGFIHFSTATQVKETVAKHFAGREGLVLVWVDAEQLGSNLKWEVSRGGVQFPHLFAELPIAAVERVDDLPLKDGNHIFPDDLA